jgi:hypothetical protein
VATRQIQTNFTAGELDPRLVAQTRLKAYYNGAELMRNVLVIPQGGFKRRPGLQLTFALGAGADFLPIPFSFNTEQLYLLVLRNAAFDIILVDPVGFNDAWAASGVQPYTEAELPLINWAQSADTLLTVHPDREPQRFIRISHVSWSVAAIPFTNIPTYDFGSGPEPVMSATRGWPRAITFFQQRLFLAGLRSRPQTILASKVADFLNLDTGTGADADAINVTLDTDQINPIVNLHAGKTLQIFTTGSEFILDPGEAPVTPKNIAVREQTRRGSKPGVRPGELDGASYYIQRGGKALRQFLFADLEQAYKATNISVVAPHLIQDPRSLAVRKSNALDDADYIFMANADGSATAFTSLRDEEVKAFTLLNTPGEFRRVATVEGVTDWITRRINGGATKHFVERFREDGLTDSAVFVTRPAATSSVALAGQTVFAWSAGVSVSAVHVRRNGASLLASEYSVAGLPGASGSITLNTPALAGDVIRITYPLSSLAGLGHLNGEQVVAIVDGAVQQPQTVTAGAIPLAPPAETQAEAGLFYTWLVRTMPVEIQLRDGSTMVGRKARIVRATVRLDRTKGIKVNGQIVPFRQFADAPLSPLDAPIAPRTGDFRISGLQGWSDRVQLTLNNDAPLPATVLGIAYTVQA